MTPGDWMFLDRRSRWSLFSTVSLTAIAVGVQALANPTNPVIVSGDVAISGVGTSAVVVDNGSMRAIVDWEDFSIGAGESTVINQVSNNAAILNRVTGGNMSEIYGSLTSNGKVFLINENGIVIGASGQIETGGFVASTLDTSNAEFLAGGDMVFTQGIETGNGITVHGKIRSVSGGDIFLLSREIEIGESGELTAQGHVGLGAGEEILLRPTDSGEGRISIRAGKGKITNKGSVAGAVAELKAAGGNEYALAINNTGVVRATGVSKSGGRVMLTGGGTVRNTGKVQATRKVVVRSKTRIENSGEVRAADSAAGTGGQIVMESPDIVIGAGSLLDVSAALGGGSMFIGGGYQGTGKSHAGEAVDISVNAQSISVAAGAVLDASATQSGDAGEIVLWSDGTNSFAGHVAAAAADGKGGFAEISGLAGLGFTGTVNMRGSAGNGELLLDPEDIFIVNSAAEPDDGGLPTASTSVANLFISDAAIEAALASSDVMLMASNDINFGRGVSIFWTNEGGPGNDNALFSLIAQNNINALDDVIIQNYGSGDVTTDEGGISFYAANDINIGSAANRTNQVAIGSEFGVTMLEAGGNINVRGGDDNGAAASIDIASAQVGYLLDATRPDSDRNGTITLLGDNIAIQGGTAPAGQNAGFVNFAQIGHGGFQGITPSNYSVAAVNGDINVIAAGDVTLLGGREATSAAIIGHGSVITNYITASSNMSSGTLTWSQGDISGNILVDANGDVKLNAAYAPVDGSQLFAGKSDFVIARIGHGAIMSLADLGGDPGAQDGMNMQFGRIQGDIDLVVDGELTVGADIAGATPYDNYFVASTIGHGGTSVVYMIDAFGDPREGVTNITHGDIRGFDTGADENSDVDYSTGITISAGSTLVQAREVANQGGDDNVIRSQIGHSLLTYADVAGSGATSDGAQSITVSEGRITGDITVYDTDNTDAKGVMLDASILPGADFAVDYDSVVARIGHGTGQYITGAPGMPVSGRNGTNVTIVQAHILGADILIDTKSQGTVTTSDDAIEANDQDVTIKTSIAAALTGALDNTAIAQIGHGGDTRIATGDGGSSTLGDFDAGNGGDIAIARGTVWDGGLTANDTSTDFRETNSTDITVFSSNQIIVDSDTAAALAAAERNTSLSQIGHGFNMSLTTGAGGNAGLNAGSGGTGGDVLVFQGVDARDYGLAEGFDDHARGTRGNIALRADAATGAAGTYAIEVNSKDASALAATNFNSDYSQIGHSDLIEIVTGNGGNGTQADGTGPDNEGDLRLVAGADQLNAAGGRGGHIDVQLGRVRAGQAGIGIERSGGANAADTDLSQGVMLTEGDISITAYGAVLVEFDGSQCPVPRILCSDGVRHRPWHAHPCRQRQWRRCRQRKLPGKRSIRPAQRNGWRRVPQLCGPRWLQSWRQWRRCAHNQWGHHRPLCRWQQHPPRHRRGQCQRLNHPHRGQRCARFDARRQPDCP